MFCHRLCLWKYLYSVSFLLSVFFFVIDTFKANFYSNKRVCFSVDVAHLLIVDPRLDRNWEHWERWERWERCSSRIIFIFRHVFVTNHIFHLSVFFNQSKLLELLRFHQ